MNVLARLLVILPSVASLLERLPEYQRRVVAIVLMVASFAVLLWLALYKPEEALLSAFGAVFAMASGLVTTAPKPPEPPSNEGI